MNHLLKKIIVTLAVFLILGALNILYGGEFSDLFALPLNIVFLLSFALAGIWAHFQTASLKLYLSFVISGKLPENITPSFINLISDQIRKLLFLGAHVIALIGVIQVMKGLQNIEAVGHGFGVTLTGYFNASLLALVLPSYVDERNIEQRP